MSNNRLTASQGDVTPMQPAAGRASWVGTLQAGSLRVPVKAFAAVASSTDGLLHQVHAGCRQRITYRKCCSDHGELAPEEIAKAYEYSPDQLIELSDDELSRLRPADHKTIVLERFFSRDQLDLALLAGRSLYLTPANPAASQPYTAVLRALSQKRKWALGHVVFSGRCQLVVIHPREATLILHTLHNPAQVRAPICPPAGQNGAARGQTSAIVKVIDGASGPIPWSDYRDDTGEKLATLVRDKIAGRRNGRTKMAAPRTPRGGAQKSPSRRRAKAA